jgi:protein-S-isoprenylcysteine O-methyltransferase Ste14
MLLLFTTNVLPWFEDPFSPRQVVSWLLLFTSPYLVIAGARDLRRFGRPDDRREDEQLYSFEKTTRLVTEGIYGEIRHPLYGSLLLLTWGIFLKNITWVSGGLALVATIFLWATAKADEVECLGYFGMAYADYMTKTKRFVPRLF